jgi:hypothetical protein
MGRLAPAATLAAASVLVLAAASAARQHTRPLLRLEGGGLARVSLCGFTRAARVLPRPRATIVLTPARGGATRLTLAVERCRAGRWVPTLFERLRVRGSRRTSLLLAGPGDYRLRVRAGRRTVTRYLRVAGRFGLPTPAAPVGNVVDLPVRFPVQNVNRSAVSCSSDGRDYRISGHLVGPRAVLASATPPAVTLYLHEFSWGEVFWRFPAAGYDYAIEQARAGQVSVTIDRLGYNASPHPTGTDTCQGAQADMAHQMVQQLRAGRYDSPGASPRRFGRVAIAGHGVGGGIAELEAYSFHDVDALVLFAWANQGFTPHATQDGVAQGGACATGGEQSGGASGYAYFSGSPDDFRQTDFADADSAIVDAAVATRQPDPCGDVSSQVPTIAASGVRAGEVTAPVLLLYGLADAVYQQPSTGQQQSQMYRSSPDVTTGWFERAGHSLTLQRSAPAVRREVADWLARHGV